MDFSSSVLTIEIQAHVATLWLDRPEKRNAMAREIVADLPRAMAAIEQHDDIRAVIIAARGKSFTVGLDLGSMTGGASGSEESVSGAIASLRQMKITTDFQNAISAVAKSNVKRSPNGEPATSP